MRRTRHVVLPVKSWQYMGLMVVSLACLTLGLVSRDRGGRSGSLAGPELEHTAPHGVDACPNLRLIDRMSPYDESALKNGPYDNSIHKQARARITGDSNARVSRSLSVEPPRNASSTFRKTKFSNQERRSIITDRRIRKIEISRIRVDKSNGQTSATSQIREVREKSSSLSREKRSRVRDYRSVATPRRTREINGYTKPSPDRTSVLRSLVLRQEPISIIRQSRTNSRIRRSSTNDRRIRETASSDRREIYSKSGRLTLKSHDRRASERRENGAVRSQSNEEKTSERRIDDYERRTRDNGVLRRSIRSVDGRDNRHDRSSRRLESWKNRVERTIEGRRSDDPVGSQTPENRQRRFDLTRKRDTDKRRTMVRKSGIRSQERVSAERRGINQRERRDRLVEGSLRTSVDVRRSRFEDFQRASVGRIGVGTTERRSVEKRDKDTTMERRNGRAEFSRSSRSERGIATSERREKRVNILAGSRVARQSSRHNIDRVDTERMRVHSEENNSPKREQISRIQRRKVQIDVTTRSRKVQASRSPRSDRVGLERTERRNDRSVRRLYRERLERKLAELSQNRGSAERRESDRLERRQNPSALLARNEKGLTSGTYVTGERAQIYSPRRNVRSIEESKIRGYTVRGERFAVRDVSRERKTITFERSNGRRQTFSKNSPVRSSPSVSENADSKDRERLVTRDASQGRRQRLTERAINRKVRTSRANDAADNHREGIKIINEIRASRGSNKRENVNERSRLNFANLPDFAEMRQISKVKNSDYLHQSLVLVLCLAYGASLLKGKGSFYSFRNIITRANRFVVW